VLRVSGDSMVPVAPPGSLLVIEQEPLRFGDIGVFAVGEGLVAHRVIWRSATGGREMGDNTSTCRRFEGVDVVGRVQRIHHRGEGVDTVGVRARLRNTSAGLRLLGRLSVRGCARRAAAFAVGPTTRETNRDDQPKEPA
jgi:hypothetical protein